MSLTLISSPQTFKKQLPLTLIKIKQLWNSVSEKDASTRNLEELCHLVGSLTDLAETNSVVLLSQVAHELTLALTSLIEKSTTKPITKKQLQKLENGFEQLQQSTDDYLSIDNYYTGTRQQGYERDNNLVYLLAENDLLADKLILAIEKAHFRVRHFTEINEIENECVKELPVCIIVDENVSDVTGIDIISQLKDDIKVCHPIIFISEQDSAELRLKATRAGVTRYFCKPLQTNKLIYTLTGLEQKSESSPYRVLLIDDNEISLKCHHAVLKNAGLEVEVLTNPLDVFKMLHKFNPDLIVTDVYMPECSGPELIKMVRQDDKWALIPFIYLSGDQNIDNQLDAMNFGAEEFLVKPVKNSKLVMVITAAAKRARYNVQLHMDLKKALRENKNQLITLNKHALVSTADVTGRITEVNEKFCEVSAYSRNELIGQNHRILKSNYHPDSFYQDMWTTISSGKIWHGTICNYNKHGEEYWVESTIVPFLDEKGKPYKYVSARTDVTKVIQSEERLERSQKFANIGTWDWNLESGKLFWSELLWSLFGFDKALVDATYENFTSIIHPEDQQLVSAAVKRSVENGAEYNIEHRVVWADGSIHWLHESGDVVRDKNGKPVRMLGIIQDISQRKEDEKALINAIEEADIANRAKSQFLASMSHELRTPMNAILGFSQLLKMETAQPLNEKQQGSVNEIITAGNHLMILIDEVLDLSKIESGRIDISISDVELAKVLLESLHIIAPLAKRNDIEIKLQENGLESSIEALIEKHIIIRADNSRLKQVLINLLSNAVKYNKEHGSVTINCVHTHDNKISVRISDTGIGLNQEQQENMFTAFNRLGAEHTTVDGTGIGLVISKNIVELMGGHILVDSQKGVGSTFAIDFPCVSGFHENKKRQLEEGINDPADEIYLANIDNKYTVLYIEDNPSNLRLVSNILGRSANLHMWTAHEPILGIELAIEHKPDLILLDINLPGMNGFEVIEKLRGNDVTKDIPVIAVTANAMPEDIEKGMNAGFDDYVVKPIDVTALLLVVDKYLEDN